MVSLADRRRAAEHLEDAFAVSERRACRVVEVARSTKRRPSGRAEDVALVAKIHRLSEEYPRFGSRKIHWMLEAAGWGVCRERVRLLRRREGLRVPQRAPKRRRPGTSTADPDRAAYSNHVWSYDFVSDQTTDGKTLRFLTVIDEHSRRGLWIECARHLTSVAVIRVLEQLVELYGVPTTIKSDNGPEFVAKKVQEWIEERGIGARFIEPGSPWQNGHNESFNGVFRDGCLNRWLFESVREAREATEAWLSEYNQERPHGSLGGLTPSAFFEREEGEEKEAA
jgi:transposase InsO family protein